MLKQRIITAIVLATFFLLVLFGLSPAAFTMVMALVVGLAAWEWSTLAGFDTRVSRSAYVVGVLAILAALNGWLGFNAGSLSAAGVRSLLAWACCWWAVALLWIQGYPSSALLWGRCWLCGIMGVAVLIPTWVALAVLVHADDGTWLVLGAILLVALADIGAFFVGRTWGRHKLAVQVSPGKTWEGLAGGMFAVGLVIVPFALYKSDGQGQLWAWLLLAGATGLASVTGDLLESMVKRHRGVKDSGTILPGHGGVLDRIDGLTAALPVFSLLYALLHTRLF